MTGRNIGLTTLYNMVNSTLDAGRDVEALRELHRQIDVEVIGAYGWATSSQSMGVQLQAARPLLG
ncbi:hypothetical protein [Xylanimonas allomyrinae]|uniref:hypothetical protein n=1 Tax=Xylanimonas allomyrinae TaxID=2509459 RepID=UPI001FEAAC2C|nr:hypothetical protein [Xylanimonas allomyrinae]